MKQDNRTAPAEQEGSEGLAGCLKVWLIIVGILAVAAAGCYYLFKFLF